MRGAVKVNPSTRGVELQISLGNYRGRAGLDVPVTLSYTSKLWNVEFQGFNTGAPPPHQPEPFTIVTAEYAKHSVAGWTSNIGFPQRDFSPGDKIYDQFGSPKIDGVCTSGCYVVDRMMIWMPDGSGHELRASDQPRLTTQAVPDTYYSVDGSRMRYQRSTQILYLPDGSQYQFVGAKFIDRNGNTLTANNGWSDTLGRTINNPLPYNPGSGPLSPTDQTYSLPGVGGTSITYTLKWRNLADVLTTPEPIRYVADGGCPPGQGAFSPYLFTSDGSSRTCIGNAGVQFDPVVLSQIVLPTGQSYSFTYDIFGAINKVVMPTGGYDQFEYSFVGPISSPLNFKFVYAQGNRGVTRHVQSFSGLAGEEVQWLYSGSGNFISITAPDGSYSERYLWTDGLSGWGYSADSSRAGQAFDERSYSPTGQMLRRKLTDWAVTPSNATGNPSGTQVANRNARVLREVDFILDTSGGPALAKSRTYNYDLTYQWDVGIERTAVNEFDYVDVDQTTAQTIAIGSLGSIPNGTLLRTTEYDYLTGDANYRSRNLLGLVTATRVKNGDGTVVGQTINTYDEAAFPLLTYASVTGWTDPGTPYRGNVTTGTTWLSFDGTTLFNFPQGPTVSTHTQYDQCGSVRKAFDAKDTSLSNPALIDYSSTYQRAYPTTQTSSDPDGAGPLSALTNSTEYDFSTGMVTVTTDTNGQRATYSYNEPLNRLKQIIRASTDATAKNQTTYTYDDVSRTVTVTNDLTNYNDNVLKTVRLYDGLGRLSETKQYEDATNYISVQQQYDALGRVFKVTNPFRPLQGETTLWTIQTYDSLGRLLTITTPDNAVVSTSYSGNTQTVTEPTGKQRKSVMDAFARLSEVIEAPNDPSFNFVTDYQYDTLDNLTKVTQGTQVRYFMHDSLKRMIRARIVEQGTNASLNLTDPLTLNSNWSIAYVYDNNGNLTHRTDARGVISTYTYDALNRNLGVSYSNDPTGTASVTHSYDLATNGKGHIYQTQATGSSLITIDSYDALGRPTAQRQQFNISGAWGQSYTMQRSYNLAGSVATQTYPSNRMVSYTYDAGGRLNGFSGTLGDGTSRTYSNEIIYSSLGALAKEKFGTTTPIYNKLFYNNRGQLSEIRESTSYAGPTDTTFDRGAIVNYYSDQCAGMCLPTSSMTDNNGNLRKQEIYVPNQTMRWQQFEYDQLNRLSSAREVLNGGAEQWKQQFTYDRWGNRTVNTAITYGVPEKDFTVNTSNNRLGVPVGQSGTMDYDNAGNLTNDTYAGNGNRTYDAENRIVSAWGRSNQAQFYAYDGGGHRIKRIVDTVETWQIYGFDNELVAEYAASGATTNPKKEYGYRNGQLLLTATPATGQRVNFALAAGSYPFATASSSASLGFTPNATNNGDRKGLHWGSGPLTGSGWQDATSNTYPDWLQIDFNQNRTIDEIDVFTIQDNWPDPVEPTESMTFTAQGITSFDVQYWNGSSWITVPGGSITGNNKVWRKITFPAVTTSLIRVVVNGALDNFSRIVELEAWGTNGGSSSADLKWVVTDQVNTPRMVFDVSGDLANMRRHDYLPFGEDLNDIGGRTPAMGYTSDGVRQQFTAKERDVEIDLDYFGARYYSSVQGRFINPDPLFGSARPASPQSWNRYSYCINTPMIVRDPNGLNWGVTEWDDAKGHHVVYEWFYGKIGTRNGRKFTPVKFGASGSLDVPTEDGQIVRISNRGIVRQVIYSGPSGVSTGGGMSQETWNMTTGFFDGYIPLGKSAREFFFGDMAADTSSPEYENASTIGTGVAIGAQLLTGTGEAEAAGAGIKLASGAGIESTEMTMVRVIECGEKLQGIIDEAKLLTLQTGNEHALVTLASGERALVSGGPKGIFFPEGSITRIFGHTHVPGTTAWPSPDDAAALRSLGQRSSWLFAAGEKIKFTP